MDVLLISSNFCSKRCWISISRSKFCICSFKDILYRIIKCVSHIVNLDYTLISYCCWNCCRISLFKLISCSKLICSINLRYLYLLFSSINPDWISITLCLSIILNTIFVILYCISHILFLFIISYILNSNLFITSKLCSLNNFSAWLVTRNWRWCNCCCGIALNYSLNIILKCLSTIFKYILNSLCVLRNNCNSYCCFLLISSSVNCKNCLICKCILTTKTIVRSICECTIFIECYCTILWFSNLLCLDWYILIWIINNFILIII